MLQPLPAHLMEQVLEYENKYREIKQGRGNLRFMYKFRYKKEDFLVYLGKNYRNVAFWLLFNMVPYHKIPKQKIT